MDTRTSLTWSDLLPVTNWCLG